MNSASVTDRLYAGWKTHIGMFVCALIVVGTTGYIFGLFVIPVSAELGLSRATTNNGYIAFLVGSAIFAPLVGRLLDRVPARVVVGLGGLLFGIGMIGVARTQSPLLMLVLIGGPISLGVSACGTLAANTIVVRWFKRRRGTALGVLAISTSAGGFLFTPIAALLIDNFGWRIALGVFGVTACTLIPLLALLLIRNRPVGTEPGYAQEFVEEGDEADGRGDGKESSWSYPELFRNRNFWLLSIGITLLYASDQALLVSQVPHFQDSGIDVAAAALIASCMTVSAMAGKILVGYLADKVDLRFVFFAVAIAHAVLLLLYVTLPGYWMLLAFATLFGVGVGGVFPVWTTMIAWLFGPKSYGTIMGLMTIPMKVLSIMAVRMVGEVHDMTGGYATAFILFGFMILAAVMLVALIRPPNDAGHLQRLAAT